MAYTLFPAADVVYPIDGIVEIGITNDLRVMATHSREYSFHSEEWGEDESSTISNLEKPESGQVDIRCYFRPFLKEDIRIYFKPILGSERPKHTYRPKLSVAVPNTKANVNVSQNSGPSVCRSRPSVSLKVKTAGRKDRSMFKGDQPLGPLEGSRCEDALPGRVQGWHPTWTDEGLHTLAAPISPKVLEVVDTTLLPGPLKPMDPIRHSPASSGGDTLVNGRLESRSQDDSIYGTLPALPIRLAKPKNFNVPSLSDNPSEEVLLGIGGIDSASAYASSEALPTESRPSETSALQLWAQEQRRLAPTKVTDAPKSFPKKSRSVFRPSKTSGKAPDPTRELLDRHRQEDLMYMNPSKNNRLPPLTSPAEKVAHETAANTQRPNRNTAGRQAMVLRAASSETLRQGKMVITELPWSTALASATATDKAKAKKKRKRGKLIRIMQAYSKNVEGIQMIQ